MTLTEAITLCVSHHPAPYRQLKHYYKWKIVLAGMRGEILTTGNEYDKDSFMLWLKNKPVAVLLDTDVKLALDGKGKDEIGKIVNEAVREKLR